MVTPFGSLTVPADPGLLPAVEAFVGAAAERAGLPDGGPLARVVAHVCGVSIEAGYEGRREGAIEVDLRRYAGRLVAGVTDQGLPFDYRALRDGHDARLTELARAAEVESVHCHNRGPRGNRVEAVLHLPEARSEPPSEARPALAAGSCEDAPPLELRLMRPDEAEELARCIWRSYGTSYDGVDSYYPQRVRARLADGAMLSAGAFAPGGEMVAHLALSFLGPEARMAEAGQAAVDPRFRGHALFPRLKELLAGEARGRGLWGLYSEATAAHAGSQRANLHLGAVETGFLLGYIAPSVRYASIETGARGRPSVALMVLPVGDAPRRAVHLPEDWGGRIESLYGRLGLERECAAGPPAGFDAATRLDLSVDVVRGTARLEARSFGADWLDKVGERAAELEQRGVAVVYLDLPLGDARAAAGAPGLRALGFSFGGLLPELHAGDVLRVQRLGAGTGELAPIATASEPGRELLGDVLREAGRSS
jgi:serine/threonine-protein kinase RsbW